MFSAHKGAAQAPPLDTPLQKVELDSTLFILCYVTLRNVSCNLCRTLQKFSLPYIFTMSSMGLNFVIS